MNNIKIERWNHIFVKEISEILSTEIKDEEIQFVTVTGCDITSDLSYAKVYVTVLDDSKKESTLKALNKASAYIRSELSQRIEIRHTPELKFLYDDSIAYGNKIEEIIEDLHEEQ